MNTAVIVCSEFEIGSELDRVPNKIWLLIYYLRKWDYVDDETISIWVPVTKTDKLRVYFRHFRLYHFQIRATERRKGGGQRKERRKIRAKADKQVIGQGAERTRTCDKTRLKWVMRAYEANWIQRLRNEVNKTRRNEISDPPAPPPPPPSPPSRDSGGGGGGVEDGGKAAAKGSAMIGTKLIRLVFPLSPPPHGLVSLIYRLFPPRFLR